MSTFQTLIDSLHFGTNPYTGFKYEKSELDTQGWHSDHPILKEAIERHNPKIIIEVGTWKGASAHHMASILKERKMDSAIICIDTWLGEQIINYPEWLPSLRITNGRPELYRTFLANTIEAGLQDYIVPLPCSTVAGARYLKSKGIAADVIYVDASHVEGDVYRDLSFYWELLNPGGSLIGDDYLPNEKFLA